MDLKTPTFELAIAGGAAPDSHGFTRLDLSFRAPGIQGTYLPFVEVEDLKRFRDGLAALGELVPGSSARLKTAESTLFVELVMRSNGGIDGSYRFETAYLGRGPVEVQGVFELDQSYLPALSQSLEMLLANLDPTSSGSAF